MSLHIQAKEGEIADTVLLPGDPLRAKWIAQTFLENPYCYNNIRGMLGYTGTYQGKLVSVQGSGMGIPSAMIYYHELVNHYGAKNLIRVGTAGALQKDLALGDIVLAMAASTNSGINNKIFRNSYYAPTANFNLLLKAADYAKKMKIPIKAGNVLSSDIFYNDDEDEYKLWAKFGVLCVEMEAAGLYTLAAKHQVNALAILTISDSLVTGAKSTTIERESTFGNMIEIALNIT
ncbi:Purine nucleoside phosphorylase DeoD-type [Arenibacter antarcticus]|uniref:Uridine phosphorylase n=1 Tax=Arenibacter antarcticus TaxID=2040469 RepID=A0ABW5VF69_9FLAO|nr:purine-nucleoside phosphorylase [Arenibacter sp. H213]MCM4169338.1 purine-nucleoside phosphorylase [Arenibacter sp. H213]